MHHKKVSIIIPVDQVENYLERAVDSALAQTLEEKEIILVDDGSLDASAQICDHYAQTYPELIQVIHKENEGLGMARNTGIRLATGEYIAFLDSDDAVEPEMYEEMYAKAIEDQCDIVMWKRAEPPSFPLIQAKKWICQIISQTEIISHTVSTSCFVDLFGKKISMKKCCLRISPSYHP